MKNQRNKTHTTIRFEQDELAAIKVIGLVENRSDSQVVRDAVRFFLKKCYHVEFNGKQLSQMPERLTQYIGERHE